MNNNIGNQKLKTRVRLLRGRAIIGLSLWFFAVLLGLSFFSYLFTWKDDQGLVLDGGTTSAHNIVGILGARLAHHSFYNGFGLSAFWLVILSFIWGRRFLMRRRLRLRKVTFNICSLMFYGSLVSAYILPSDYKDAFPFSGAVAEVLNTFLRHSIGDTGAFMVLFIFLPVLLLGLALGWRWPKKSVPSPNSGLAKDNVQLGQNPVNQNANIQAQVVRNSEPKSEVLHTEPDLQNNPIFGAENFGTEKLVQRSLHSHNPIPTPQFNNNIFDAPLTKKPVPQEIDEQKSKESKQNESSFEIIQKEPAFEVPEPNYTPNSIETQNLPNNLSPAPEIIPNQNSEHRSISPVVIQTAPSNPVVSAPNVAPSPNGVKSAEIQDLASPIAKPQNPEINNSESNNSDPSPTSSQVVQKSPQSIQAREGVYVSGAGNFATNLPPSPIPAQPANPEPVEVRAPQTASQPSVSPVSSIPVSFYDPRADLSLYKFPPVDLLREYDEASHLLSPIEKLQNEQKIASLLRKFGIKFSTVRAIVGPTVTLYEVATDLTENLSKIENRAANLAMALEAMSVRIMIPVPGKNVVGIEVPNTKRSIVGLRNLLLSSEFKESSGVLPIALGRTIDNKPFILDLADMPHLLVAGATKQGKSVGINTILLSLLYRQHPAELKLVLIDPKQVELGIYELLERHYLAKLPSEEQAVIKDSKQAVYTLQALILEMESRLSLMSLARVRDIGGYNSKFLARQLLPTEGHRFLPFIVVVIDEYADLVMNEKGVEKPLGMLAQKARAAGIHLIVATQRPVAKILEGTIKANFPGCLAFRVSSNTDSRVILDEVGAEDLIGSGDMLVKTGDVSGLKRVQCAYVSTEEVDGVLDFISKQQAYSKAYELPEYMDEEEEDEGEAEEGQDIRSTKRDKLFFEAARYLVRSQRASASSLQANYSIGQPRASRIITQLERAGIIGPLRNGKREILMTEYELEDFLDSLNNS